MLSLIINKCAIWYVLEIITKLYNLIMVSIYNTYYLSHTCICMYSLQLMKLYSINNMI